MNYKNHENRHALETPPTHREEERNCCNEFKDKVEREYLLPYVSLANGVCKIIMQNVEEKSEGKRERL